VAVNVGITFLALAVPTALPVLIGDRHYLSDSLLVEVSYGTNVDSLKEYHDVVLGNGSIPLMLLERVVNEWLASKRSGS